MACKIIEAVSDEITEEERRIIKRRLINKLKEIDERVNKEKQNKK